MNAKQAYHQNHLVYLVIVILGFLLYILYGMYDREVEAREQVERDLRFTQETQQEIQLYNEMRFDELKRVNTSKWKAGKHETTF